MINLELMFRKIIKNAWPLIFLFVFVLTFFSNIIIPEPGLFVTPDFGRSDALHSNIPSKMVLSQNLKSLNLPAWTNEIGQGFPILADGIIGTFYIPNLIIFSFSPQNWSIPVMYLSTFLICSTGMYFLLKELKMTPFIAIMGALSYTFCASMILHVQHFNFIQSASLLPLIMLFTVKLLRSSSIKNSLLLLILFSQLFFTGFFQIFVYSTLVFPLLIVVHQYLTQKSFLKILVIYLFIIVFSLLISSAQLLPSIELNSKSSRSENLNALNILGDFPMSPFDLVTYLNPFIQGQAKNGTANSMNWAEEGIYWESTSYIGILPIFLSILSLFFIFKKGKKETIVYLIFALFAFLTILMSLGKFSPTHILFSFPPLNLFRVPSRFILFTQFFLVILSAYSADKIIQMSPSKLKRHISTLLMLLIAADIFLVWWSYNPVGSFKKWTHIPETAQLIKKIDQNSRIISFGCLEAWNKTFLKEGWKSKLETYYIDRNCLNPNINIMFGLNNFNIYTNLSTRRYDLQNSILLNDIKLNENEIIIGEKSKTILDNSYVRFILSTKEIKNNDYKKIFTIENDGVQFMIFESNKNLGIGKIYYKYKTVSSPDEYQSIYKDTDLESTVILEDKLSNDNLEEGSNKVRLEKFTNDSFEFEAETNKPGVFVLSNSFYPGWTAKIDGKVTEIFAANINNQAISIPTGSHKVSFSYQPKQLRIGLIITLISYLTILLLLFKKRISFFKTHLIQIYS